MEPKTSESTFKKLFFFLCSFVAGFLFGLIMFEAGRKWAYELLCVMSMIVGVIALALIGSSFVNWLFKKVVKRFTSRRQVTNL